MPGVVRAAAAISDAISDASFIILEATPQLRTPDERGLAAGARSSQRWRRRVGAPSRGAAGDGGGAAGGMSADEVGSIEYR